MVRTVYDIQENEQRIKRTKIYNQKLTKNCINYKKKHNGQLTLGKTKSTISYIKKKKNRK